MKKVMFSSFLLFLSVVLLSPGTAFAAGAGDATPDDAVPIGIIGPMTGWATVYGANVVHGAELAIAEYKEAGGEMNFRLFSEDSKGDVEVMVTKLGLLTERDGAKIIIGPSLGHEGMAAADWAQKNPDITIMPGFSAPEDLTMRKRSAGLIRAGWTGSQVIFNFGQFVARDLAYDKVIMVGQDYAYPWGQAGGFIRGFIENGGEEVLRIWHPVEALDFGSIMSDLQAKAGDYDAVVYNGAGAQAIAFFKQWREFGLDQEYPQLLGGANVTDVPLIPELGDSAEGIYASMHYVETWDSPANRNFRMKYNAEYGEFPDAISLQGYDTMKLIIYALESTGNDFTSPTEFREAILGSAVTDSPRGSFYFDEYNQAVQNIYIKRLDMVDGQLMNSIVRTYERVSQFGPYIGYEEEYMSQPPNTRDYPPGTRAEYFAEARKYFPAAYFEALEANDGWAD